MMNCYRVTLFLLAGLFLARVDAHVTWKLATGYRAESFHTQNIKGFANDVARATDNGLRIEVYPGNSLVSLNDVRQAVQDGRVDAGETIMTSMVKDLNVAGADSIPFVVGSYSDARRLWQLQRPTLERLLAQRGPKSCTLCRGRRRASTPSAPLRRPRTFAVSTCELTTKRQFVSRNRSERRQSMWRWSMSAKR